MINTYTKPATHTAAKTTNINIAQLTPEQIQELVAQHTKNQNAKFSELEAELTGRFQECETLLAEMRGIRPDYKAAWEIVASPQACANDIKAMIAQNGGSATKTEILAALGANYDEAKIEKTLVNRCSGDRPLWHYDTKTETYQLRKQ